MAVVERPVVITTDIFPAITAVLRPVDAGAKLAHILVVRVGLSIDTLWRLETMLNDRHDCVGIG